MSLTKTSYSMIRGAPANVVDFGADPTGVADSTAAIQAALDSVPNAANSYCPSKTSGGAGEIDVIFPEGTYLVNSCLIANQRGWQRLIGIGRVDIYSSSTTYVIDMSSTFRCGIESINFITSTAGVGLYMSRCTSNPFTVFNEFRNVNFQMNTGITANGGIGAIAFYMDRIEQNLFYNCVFNGDCCLYNTPVAIGLFPPASGTQDTTTNSNTVNTFIQSNFTKNGSHQFGMILKQATAFRFFNCYWNDLGVTAGSVPYAFSLNGISECLFQGDFDSLIRLASVQSINYFNSFELLLPTSGMSNSIFNFDTAGAHEMALSDFKIFTSGSSAGLTLFLQSLGTSSVQIRGNKIDTISDLTIASGANLVMTNNLFATEGALRFNGSEVKSTGAVTAFEQTSPGANGAGNLALTVSSVSNLGVFVGVGAPGINAAQGSLYLNTTGSSTSTRLYVNTNGTNGWTSVTTAT
jgi:hypothetical protein